MGPPVENDYKRVQSKEALIALLNSLAQQDTDNWENMSTQDYLQALAAWLESSDAFYDNAKIPISHSPSWQLFADAMQAATIYE